MSATKTRACPADDPRGRRTRSAAAADPLDSHARTVANAIAPHITPRQPTAIVRSLPPSEAPDRQKDELMTIRFHQVRVVTWPDRASGTVVANIE